MDDQKTHVAEDLRVSDCRSASTEYHMYLLVQAAAVQLAGLTKGRKVGRHRERDEPQDTL